MKQKCALCGFASKRTRTIRLDRDNRPMRGYPAAKRGVYDYAPKLTADQFYELGEGEHDICVDRRACEVRRLKQMGLMT